MSTKKIENLQKKHNLSEYLRQRGVNSKILVNPRLDEILDELIDVFNIIHLDKETIEKLNMQISINLEGKITYRIRTPEKSSLKIVIWNKKYNCLEVFEREFVIQNNKQGVQVNRIQKYDVTGIEEQLVKEISYLIPINNYSEKNHYIPNKKVVIQRDSQIPYLFRATEKQGTMLCGSGYYEVKSLKNVHDILFGHTCEDIDDEIEIEKKHILVAKTDKEYNIIKQYKILERKNAFEEYKSENPDSIYTDGMSKRFIKNKVR